MSSQGAAVKHFLTHARAAAHFLPKHTLAESRKHAKMASMCASLVALLLGAVCVQGSTLHREPAVDEVDDRDVGRVGNHLKMFQSQCNRDCIFGMRSGRLESFFTSVFLLLFFTILSKNTPTRWARPRDRASIKKIPSSISSVKKSLPRLAGLFRVFPSAPIRFIRRGTYYAGLTLRMFGLARAYK